MIMDNFKKVLEIENKYNHQINLAKKRLNLKKENCLNDLNLKEEAIKNDFKNELNSDFVKVKKEFEKEADLLIQKALEDSKHIRREANIEGAINLILEDVKNV